MIDKKLIGENILLFERLPHPRDPTRWVEYVAPNQFNFFLT